jgi:acetoin utilization deacetylase AcuC-like enzyme
LPGTGHAHRPEAAAYNWPLPSDASGANLIEAVQQSLEIGADFRPDIVLLAAGADGHEADPLEADPLGRLSYQLSDFSTATELVSQFSEQHRGGRLLAGGAGGYRADGWTPRVWFETFKALTQEDERTHS